MNSVCTNSPSTITQGQLCLHWDDKNHMFCGIPNTLLPHAIRGKGSYHLGTSCDTFSGTHYGPFLKKHYTKARAFINIIKKWPNQEWDCCNGWLCKSTKWAVDLRLHLCSLFLWKTIIKSSKGCRMKLVYWVSFSLLFLLKNPIGIVALF